MILTYGSCACNWRSCLICVGALSKGLDCCKANGSGCGGGCCCLGACALCRCGALGALAIAASEYCAVCCALGCGCRSNDLQFTLSPFKQKRNLIFDLFRSCVRLKLTYSGKKHSTNFQYIIKDYFHKIYILHLCFNYCDSGNEYSNYQV